MRSSELQAKIDAMEPEARKAFEAKLEELFAAMEDLDDACFDYPLDEELEPVA